MHDIPILAMLRERASSGLIVATKLTIISKHHPKLSNQKESLKYLRSEDADSQDGERGVEACINIAQAP